MVVSPWSSVKTFTLNFAKSQKCFNSFRCLTLSCEFQPNLKFGLAIVYHPPKCISWFEEELLELASYLSLNHSGSTIMGDMNILFEDLPNKNIAGFITNLSSLLYTQIVSGPTHIRGHTLDWVIVIDIPLICDSPVATGWSDYYFVTCSLSLPRKKLMHFPDRCPIQKSKGSWPWEIWPAGDNISTTLFKLSTDPTEKLLIFNSCVEVALDILAPGSPDLIPDHWGKNPNGFTRSLGSSSRKVVP